MHVAATCPSDMFPLNFRVCVHNVTLLLLHVSATRPHYIPPMYEEHVTLWLHHVAATCPCVITPCGQRGALGGR